MRCAPEVDGLLLGEGSDEQIEWLNPAESEDIEQADVWIVIDSPSNTKALTSVDPERQARVQRARIGWRERYLERALNGELRWVLTAYPDERRRAGRRDVARRVRGLHLRCRAARRRRPGRPLARLRGRAAARGRVPEHEGGAALRRRGHRPDLRRRRRPHLGRGRRARELPGRRGLHCSDRRQRRGRDHVHVPRGLPRSAGGRRAPALPGGRGRRGDCLERRGLPAGDGRARRRARGGWASSPSG